MNKTLFFLFFLLFSNAFVHANDADQLDPIAKTSFVKNYSSFLIGHNLTPTSYTIAKDQLIAGPYYIAYGISNQLMLGTSPWMIIEYNMPMLSLKYSFIPSTIFDHASIELMYFKTFQYGFNDYHQESTWVRFTGTVDINENYKIHGCLGIQYFFDDLVAYSMRPPPLNNTPFTFSLSALQEIHFSKDKGIFLESGFLGLNYPNRYLQLGVSGFYEWSTGYLQLGLSKTFAIGPEYLSNNIYSYSNWQDRVWKVKEGDYSSSIYYLYSQPIHPEIQIEFLL